MARRMGIIEAGQVLGGRYRLDGFWAAGLDIWRAIDLLAAPRVVAVKFIRRVSPIRRFGTSVPNRGRALDVESPEHCLDYGSREPERTPVLCNGVP
jgi:hypothetical protein